MTPDNKTPLCFEEQKILAYSVGGGFLEKTVSVIQETSLKILLNGTEIVAIACSGNHPEELAVGFLRAEGFVVNASDIEEIEICDDGKCVHVRTKDNLPRTGACSQTPVAIESSGAMGWRGKGLSSSRKDLSERKVFIAAESVFNLMEQFVEASSLYRVTGGTHSAALSDGECIIALREDIGRHNTIDMLGGYTLLRGIDCSGKIILRTGRISSEIVHKVWNLGVVVMISLSVPTSAAIHLAERGGITLLGSVKGEKMNIYCHEWRIKQ